MASIKFSLFDLHMMERALKLARAGIYTTAPNPNVGCVIVQGETIVGEGAHLKPGQPHAEVFALRKAGKNAKGATAYVTLEPCAHYGKTPPCAQALIDAKIKRVVCAMKDPNPQVSGRGIALLREAGIEVEVGLGEIQSHLLNAGFIKRMQEGLPYVQLKLAMSLDGKTALANGQSKWITGKQARADVQKYRAQAGAILSTSQTVIGDDASLNVRYDELSPEIQERLIRALGKDAAKEIAQPKRVILNRKQALNLSNFDHFKLGHIKSDIILVESDKAKLNQFPHSHVTTMPAPVENERFNLKHILISLAKEHDINHLWVEAGASLATSFIEQGLVDELIVYIAPKLMGNDGKGLSYIQDINLMSDVKMLNFTDVAQVGDDIRLTAYIKPNQNPR